MREFLTETVAYIPPARALEELETAVAERRLPGANHSIAEIVAHMNFWMSWFTSRCEGSGEPVAANAAQGWPAVAPGSWPELHARFLTSLEKAAALGEEEGRLDVRLEPPLEFPPLAHYTRRDALVHVVSHNAHHLGQVIVLRQLLGVWPPPSGSWTW
jgi:uncharacterized damage-inducible protein DinB